MTPLNFCKVKSRKTHNLIPSYIHFICEVDCENTQELNQILLVEELNQFIRLISTLLPAIRIDEWCILDYLLKSENYSATVLELFEEIRKYVDIDHSNNLIHACGMLSGKYADKDELIKYEKAFCTFDGNTITLNSEFIYVLENNSCSALFKLWLNDTIHYAQVRYTEEFGRIDYGYPFLKLYHGYTMKHPAIASNYQKSISSFRGSGLLTNCKPDYFIFVDLYKDENIREEINYKDKFLTRKEFQWQSPNDSIRAKGSGFEIVHNMERGNILHLFVRKYSEIEKIPQPYIYLGKVNTHPESATGDKPITMTFALEEELPQDLYEDFITNEKFIETEEDK